MKILIIQTASIGDVILATPIVEKLHRFDPSATIDLLVKKGNEPLFRGHPFLHEVITWDKNSNATGNFIGLLQRVRKNRYDLVVNVQRFFKTGFLTAFSGAERTVGFDKNPLSFLFTSRIPHKLDGVHEVERNLALVEGITGGGPEKPRLYPCETDFEKVASFKGRTYYAVSPASLWFTKQYPPEKWAELIRLIPGDAAVYLLGSPGDRELCDRIMKEAGHPGARILAGTLDLLQSAALMKDAKMNFTNDSAPMHLASSVNAPVTAVYCSTVPEFGFGPLSDDALAIGTEEPLSCRPCGLHGYRACPEKHFRCATGIRAGQLAVRL